MRAGAVAIAVGRALVEDGLMAEGRFGLSTEKGRRFAQAVRDARQEITQKKV